MGDNLPKGFELAGCLLFMACSGCVFTVFYAYLLCRAYETLKEKGVTDTAVAIGVVGLLAVYVRIEFSLYK